TQQIHKPSETLGLATQPTLFQNAFRVTFSCILLYLYCRRLAALLAYFFEWVKECKAASRQCLILNCRINIFQISLCKRHGGIVGAA
ncbi:MAG TPA: hypothetical protein PL031_06800, partial [Neisseria sp.]|nr:hypothetical protein [Neisseria sp.]